MPADNQRTWLKIRNPGIQTVRSSLILLATAGSLITLPACSDDPTFDQTQSESQIQSQGARPTNQTQTTDVTTAVSIVDTELNTIVQTTGAPDNNSPAAIASPNSDDHPHPTTTSVRFTDSNQDIWPPQPLNITNVQVLSSNTVTKRNVVDYIPLLLSDSDIRQQLGKRYSILTNQQRSDKSNALSYIEVEVFAYDSNQVITVKINTDSTDIISYQSVSASEYQPPESNAEVQRAIALAADALNAQGFTDHLKLKGTGLLAFPSATQTATSGSAFYNDRKIYVTFGSGNGELPQYRALVNLSHSTVETSGAIQ